MKRYIYIILAVFLIASCGQKIPATAKTDTFPVSGNCGMCKKRIEKSLRLDGIYKANWNKTTKMLTVSYEPSKINLDEIKRHVAKAGHDNDVYKADTQDYEDLHSCCKYER